MAHRKFNKIFQCIYQSKKIDNPHVWVYVRQDRIRLARKQLGRALAMESDDEVGADNKTVSRFLNIPIFDRKQPKELKEWRFYLWNMLLAQPTIYTNPIA